MHRCAAFVDMGYVRAALRLLGGGKPGGGQARFDYGSMARGLAVFVSEDCGLALLRSYWYDAGASSGDTSARRLVREPRVKVRMGVLTATGQKEVDILLHEDVVGLAAGGLVSTMYVLSGDGDFRPTLARAQGHGTEMVVLDIVGSAASQRLAQEADRHVTLAARFFDDYLEGGDEGGRPLDQRSLASGPLRDAGLPGRRGFRPRVGADA